MVMKDLNLKLINGKFSVEESIKILCDLYASKIQFHEKKKLTALIKNQGEDAHSIERINQLKLDMDYIKSQLSSLNQGTEVTIECDIHIKLTQPEV